MYIFASAIKFEVTRSLENFTLKKVGGGLEFSEMGRGFLTPLQTMNPSSVLIYGGVEMKNHRREGMKIFL